MGPLGNDEKEGNKEKDKDKENKNANENGHIYANTKTRAKANAKAKEEVQPKKDRPNKSGFVALNWSKCMKREKDWRSVDCWGQLQQQFSQQFTHWTNVVDELKTTSLLHLSSFLQQRILLAHPVYADDFKFTCGISIHYTYTYTIYIHAYVLCSRS
ncbi:hypothetical protein RFI_09911 [Reticulomyxa filosa]|uniref:Uncharacterized protein n=1 Tax=Reticulomyxa filosa TaxID=46433 RepID=X6NLQ5_RETFI|nr:hypothetical protein RFI_09911 [Reticulomyxa filosa]|eukprot:ETO27220.1 hypothetical protein RFI_09911 [Reticulomyxa filosa]